jgi:flagellar biosynthesis/type III secretory pathway M-ring protein FliF/YscJ
VLTLTDSDGQTAEITLVDGSAQITGNGKYILTATDGAGNVNEYEFTLGTTGSGKSSLWIMLLLLIFIIAVIAGIILVFKKLLFPGSKDKTPKEKKKKKEEQEKQTQNEADDWEDTDTLQQTEIEAAQQAEDDWEEG